MSTAVGDFIAGRKSTEALERQRFASIAGLMHAETY